MPVSAGSLRLPAPELKFLRPNPGGEESFSALQGRFASWVETAQTGTQHPEVLSLLKESDEEIFVASWISFASRQERAGREEQAAAIYSLLQDHPAGAKAKQRLAALQGEGNFGLRAERMLRKFHEEAFDPAMLGGMMVASTAFSGLRMVGLSRLLRAEAGFWTRGRGAQFLASGMGLSGEVPAFLFSSKGLSELFGHRQDWRAQSLVHEGSALGLSLLYLKGFGALGRKGAQWQGGALTRRTLPEASAFAGLYFGRQTEAALGLRPATDTETALTESLVFLLQLKAGGDLSHRLMGRTWRSALQETQWRASQSLPPISPRLLSVLPSPIALGPRRFPVAENKETKRSEPVFMVGDQPHSSKIFSQNLMAGQFNQNFPPPPEASVELRRNYPEIVARIVENIQKTPGLDAVDFYLKLSNSRIKDAFNDRKTMTSRIEILDHATTYWRNALEMNPLRRASGCLYDHLMQEALERTFREGDRADWDALIKVAGWDRRIRHLDVFFQERGWDLRYAFQDQPESGILAKPWRNAVAWYRTKIQKLPPERQTYAAEVEGLALSLESQLAVTRYLDTFIHGREAKAFLESEHNYILLKPAQGPERRERLTPKLALAALDNFLKTSGSSNGRRIRGLEDAIQKAAQSGTPLLQFDRLFKILATGNLSPKLVEIASGEPFHWGKLQGIIKLSAGEENYHSAGNHINGSIYTGYVSDPVLAEKFARFYDKVSKVLTPHEQELRRRQFYLHAQRVLRNSPNHEFGTDEVLELLNLRNTPISKLAREKILEGEVDLKVVSREEAQAIYDSLRNNENRGKPVPVAFYAPAVKNPEGVPLIVVQRQNPALPLSQRVADAASLAAIVVHEFQHYLDSQTHSYFEPMERLRSEMRAWLEEIAFMVENGVMDEWNKVEPQSPYGFGVHLRNLIDRDYIEGPRDLVVPTEK
ncbi:MAG TPA: hypothetical protein VJP40_09360 [bacterium]|nr:hypothetical protein [bacterium]